MVCGVKKLKTWVTVCLQGVRVQSNLHGHSRALQTSSQTGLLQSCTAPVHPNGAASEAALAVKGALVGVSSRPAQAQLGLAVDCIPLFCSPVGQWGWGWG